jgi:SPP1 family predicted phage head-tail adaptor
MPQAPQGAGPLFTLCAFDQLIEAQDGYGNLTSAFEEQFQLHANFMFLRGGEQVIAARLQGQQPAIVRIRVCHDSERVTPDWQLRDVREGVSYNIRSITMAPDRGYFDLLVQAGVAN